MHPDDVESYSRIKVEGARLYPQDIEAYAGYKAPFITEIYRKLGW